MDAIEVLVEPHYPVIRDVVALKSNAKTIIGTLNSKYPGKNIWITGIGTSGAMVMTSLLYENEKLKPFFLKKTNEQTHRSPMEVDRVPSSTENDIIVVVDDMAITGSTVKNIAEKLKEYVLFVKVIAISGFKKRFTTEQITKMFPNLELIIY